MDAAEDEIVVDSMEVSISFCSPCFLCHGDTVHLQLLSFSTEWHLLVVNLDPNLVLKTSGYNTGTKKMNLNNTSLHYKAMRLIFFQIPGYNKDFVLPPQQLLSLDQAILQSIDRCRKYTSF